MDDRVVAAAPTCYITSYRRLLESIGPQDGEQNLFHGLATGIDHAELLIARAPKPTLVVATTRDFFSIQGVHETADELHKVYEAFAAEDHFDQVEDDSGHGFTRRNNEATYAFFQKHLQLPGDPAEQQIPFLAEEELTVTPTGQVSTSYASRGVFELNLEVVKPLLEQLEKNRNERPDQHLKNALSEARRLSGYRDPESSNRSVYQGRYQRDGYTIEKHVLAGEGGTPLPILIFVPEGEGPFPAVVYLNPRGKQADAARGGPIEQLTRAGYLVVAPDLLGVGETDSQIDSSHSSVAAFYSAQLAGRSVVGIQAAGVVQLSSYCRVRPEVSKDRIALVGIGDLGPAALLAAALEPSVRALVLSGSPISFASLATHRFYEIEPNALIAGALTGFDLADLMANVAPRRLAIRSPVDHAGKGLDLEPIPSDLEFVTRVFEAKGVLDKVRVAPNEVSLVDLVDWSFE
jgi:pimeloyl-ACP methyl ester carboxylesterase